MLIFISITNFRIFWKSSLIDKREIKFVLIKFQFEFRLIQYRNKIRQYTSKNIHSFVSKFTKYTCNSGFSQGRVSCFDFPCLLGLSLWLQGRLCPDRLKFNEITYRFLQKNLRHFCNKGLTRWHREKSL